MWPQSLQCDAQQVYFAAGVGEFLTQLRDDIDQFRRLLDRLENSPPPPRKRG